MIRRVVALSISIAWLLLAINQQSTALSTSDHDACAEKKCSPKGPAVRFPFVLQGKQPEFCGYNSSYNLHCDEMNRTILEFSSSSVKVEVTNLSYLKQSINVRPVETCFAIAFRDFDIYTTPFWHPAPYYDDFGYLNYNEPIQYSLFNCSPFNSLSSDGDWPSISCLENSGFKVYAIYSQTDVWYLAEEGENCTKMYDTKWVKLDMLFTDFMKMSWSLPQCQECEIQGGICRWKDGTRNEISCVGGYKHHSGGELKKFIVSSPFIGCLFLALAATGIYLAYSTKKLDREDQIRLKNFLEDYAAMKLTRYSYADIKKITNDFKDKLGEGGYGNVYKGTVSNKICVAVKLLHSSTENGEDFVNEVGTMGKIHHINVVRLLGFCADGYQKALVYEFLPNGSLDKVILPDGKEHHTIGMEMLLDIAVGIARGIEYLHQGCEQRILHFDIKPHNILLDENYNPKISDFGLARLCEKGRSTVSMTGARGTMGYIAPEVFSRHFGNVSYKSDIYSFGKMLLDMVARGKNIDSDAENTSQVYFPEWIYSRLLKGEEEFEIQVDDEEDGEDQICKKLAIVGLWCIQWNPTNRPSISFVLQMLEGNAKNLILPPNPFSSSNAVNPANPSTEHKRLPFNSTLAVISESG